MFFRKKYFIFSAILSLFVILSFLLFNLGEEVVYENITSTIDEKNIKNTLDELTSKEYNGRLIGTRGNKLATDFIVNEFKKMGLKNPENLKGYEQPYTQNVRVTNKSPRLIVLDDGNSFKKEYRYIEDFSVVTYNSMLRISGESQGRGVLLKNIQELSEEKDKFRGKIVLVPKNLLKDDGLRTLALSFVENKLDITGVVIQVDIEKKTNSTFPVAPNASPVDDFSKSGAIFFTAETESFKQLVKYSEENKKIYMSADYSIENVKGSNVIGVIEGTDEKLKNEQVIIGAHFDHVGDNKNETYNPGALDNASGTASMIEIARAIVENKIPPKKTIVFIGFNGEEEGLYGSFHYVANPIYPLNDKTKMINLDMVGSKRKVPLEIISYDEEDIEFREEFLSLSREFGIIAKEGVSQGSDHVPFAVKGIKSVCLINMDLESGYHTPVDTKDKVDIRRNKDISSLVLYYLDKNIY